MKNKNWWKEGIVYQIYPRSFLDTNNDGIGDLQGIIRKIDYLADLGVNILWITPVFTSPNCDNGYDISDYRSIDPVYGNFDDWNELIAKAHKQSLYIVADLVFNHSSAQHPWFKEAQKSKDNPYHDYYIWRSGIKDSPPNNWTAFFGGSSWTWNAQSQEYYLHTFTPEQPDLNWENPRVRQEMYNIMRFWLDRGIDGFRMDVINMISKNQDFPDGARTAYGRPCGMEHYCNGPRIHEYLQEMHREVLSYYNVFTVGECPEVSPETALLYVGENRKELQMIFQFEGQDLFISPENRWKKHTPSLPEYKRYVERWQNGLNGKGWNSLFLSNHDFPRAVSKMGNDAEYRLPSAKLLLLHILTLEGTPYIYQGEEIGMTNVAFESIEDYRDIWTLNFYAAANKKGMPQAEILRCIHQQGRDNSRTPMQWSDEEHAGFSTSKSWIPLNKNYRSINVSEALADPQSILHFTRKAIRIRKEHPALIYGSFRVLCSEHPRLFAYTRSYEDSHYLILMNFSNEHTDIPGTNSASRTDHADSNPDMEVTQTPEQYAELELLLGKKINLLLANYSNSGDTLRPWEARLYQIQG